MCFLLVDDANEGSEKKGEKTKKGVCHHRFNVTFARRAHLGFCHVVECPFAPNKSTQAPEVSRLKQPLSDVKQLERVSRCHRH